jgi:type IV secretory pathway component VirB8
MRRYERLFKAKDLQSYATTTEAMRQLFMTHQAEDNITSRKKTIKYSASSLKLKDILLLKL